MMSNELYKNQSDYSFRILTTRFLNSTPTFFEDGVGADLQEIGATTLAEAFAEGYREAKNELSLILKTSGQDKPGE